MEEGCSRGMDSVRGAKGPHERGASKMRKCDEDKAKTRIPKIGRPRGVQGSIEPEATKGPHGASRKETACWVSRGLRFLTRIDRRPTTRTSKGVLEMEFS